MVKFEKLLVLVPHQDDELNIAGQVLPAFIETGCECKICFSTNGDGFKSNGPVRMKEAKKVADYLGVGCENLIFLGFDDSMGPAHPYAVVSDADVSNAPPTKVYSSGEVCCSMRRCGEALPQCRDTLVGDIKYILSSWLPDVIICVDYDSHPDHRALSLAFERAMGILLKEKRSYRPLVLKKFAYSSIWYGSEDYYTFAPTLRPGSSDVFELDNPMYVWDERIRVAPHPSTLTKRFFSNTVVKAAMRYSSQNAWWRMAAVCNSDVVYWVRRTDNMIFDGEVVASSGDVRQLLDFLLFDSADVCSDDTTSLEGSGFQFCANDGAKKVRITFNEIRQISEIIVREGIGSFGFFRNPSIALDGKEFGIIERTAIRPGCFRIAFDDPVPTRKLEIMFNNNNDCGVISSIEIYPTTIDEYEQLNAFKLLMGEPLKFSQSFLRWEIVLKQVARITGKLERIKLRWRERSA